MAEKMTHRRVIDRVQPIPGEPAVEAIYRAVASFSDVPEPQRLAEAARMVGFLHAAYRTTDVRAQGEELRAKLQAALRNRNNYYTRRRKELR